MSKAALACMTKLLAVALGAILPASNGGKNPDLMRATFEKENDELVVYTKL